ncbi:hypothetical protein [Facilibium subflavum]|uniref:hypothetical protein n=1 Tax=Facilibium subflavum TaxID=2219058 RepID=UPI000E65C3F5|nr:hypothetical protein [Facilibium subflavum]
MTWLKLITILGAAVGLSAAVLILKKYINQTKKMKTYAKGIKGLLKKSAPRKFIPMKSTDQEQNKVTTKAYLYLAKILAKSYANTHKNAALILFNGSASAIEKKYELTNLNAELNLPDSFDMLNLFVSIDGQNLRFILCLNDQSDQETIKQKISLLKRLFIILYRKKVIKPLVLQLHLDGESHQMNQQMQEYVMQFKKDKFFNQLPLQINTNIVNEIDKSTRLDLQQQTIFKNHMYTDPKQISFSLSDAFEEAKQQFISAYTWLSLQDDQNSQKNESFNIALQHVHILTQSIQQTLKQRALLDMLSPVLISRNHPIYLDFMNNERIIPVDSQMLSQHWSYYVSMCLLLSISIAISTAMINNIYTIHQNNVTLSSLLKDPLTASNIITVERFYTQTHHDLNHSLWFKSLYPEHGLYPQLDNIVTQKAWQTVVNQIGSADSSALKPVMIALLLLASDQPQLKHYIEKNTSIWANGLEVSERFLTLMLSHLPYVQSQQRLKFDCYAIKSEIQSMSIPFDQTQFVQRFIIQNKSTITMEQFQSLLVSQYQNNLMLAQLKQALPLISVTTIKQNPWINTNSWIEVVDTIKNAHQYESTKLQHEYTTLLSFITGILTTRNIENFGDLIKDLHETNTLISSMNNNTIKGYQNILMQAYLNTRINMLFKQEESQISLLPSNTYKQYITLAGFKRGQFNIPIAYTYASINEYVEPLTKTYQNLIDHYNQSAIQSSLLSNLYQIHLRQYEQEYIKNYEALLKNVLPQEIENEDIYLFLLDLGSNQSPFYNILRFIYNNTADIAEKNITQAFNGLNAFFNSNDYIEYQSQFTSSAELLVNHNFNNYQSLLNKLQSKDEDNLVVKVKTLLNKTQLPHWLENRLLMPTDILQNYLQNEMAKIIQNKWDITVMPVYKELKTYFPFNLNSKKMIDYQKITSLISPNGSLAMQMQHLLKTFIQSGANNQWRFIDSLSKQARETLKIPLQYFNEVQSWQKALWNNKAEPKAIDFKVKGAGMTNHLFSTSAITSFISSLGNKVTALNTQENQLVTLSYRWYEQPSVSIGWVSQDHQIYQQTFKGDWAFMQMIKAATIKSDNSDHYSWKISLNQHESVIVDFIVQNQILNTMGE